MGQSCLLAWSRVQHSVARRNSPASAAARKRMRRQNALQPTTWPCSRRRRALLTQRATSRDDAGATVDVPGSGSGACGPELQFSDAQLQKFEVLQGGMRGYARFTVAASGVAIAKIVTAIATTGKFAVPPSGVSYFIVHMVTAGLVWKAAALLPRPGSAPETHEPALMRALRALAVVFLQMATMHWLVSAVTMMEAAITWPPLVVVFSGLVALTCLVRVAALGYVFDRYQPKEAAQLHIDSVIGGRIGRRFKWLDRAAVIVVGGSLAGSQTARGGNQSIELGGPGSRAGEYEFTPEEETTFSDLMDSIRDTGAATVLMCLGHFMALTAKAFAPGTSLLEQWGTLTSGIEAGVMAGVMLYSVGCFGRILSTSGQDVRLLMSGISAEKGLSQLFQRLKNVQSGAVVGAFIPFAIDLGMKIASNVVDLPRGL